MSNSEGPTDNIISVRDQVDRQIYDYVYSACRRNWDWMPPYPKQAWTTSELIDAFRKPRLSDYEENWEFLEEIYRAVFYVHRKDYLYFDDLPSWLKSAESYRLKSPWMHINRLIRRFLYDINSSKRLTTWEELLYRSIGSAYLDWRDTTSDQYIERRQSDLLEEWFFLLDCEDRIKNLSDQDMHEKTEYIEVRTNQIDEERESLHGGEFGDEWRKYYDEQVDLLREWLIHHGLSASPDDLFYITRYAWIGPDDSSYEFSMRTERTLYDRIGHFWPA